MASDINLAELSADDRRRLLEELLADQNDSQSDRFITSFAQDRLWLLDKLTPGNPIYNIWAGVRLTGRIDLELVSSALDFLIDRHESLRTIFAEEGGVPYQLIQDAWNIQIPVEDLSDLSEPDRSEQLNWLVQHFIARPFQIDRGPLLRVQFIQLADREHVALFAMHHAISDGWSLGVLIKEFVEVYTALQADLPPALEALDVQYADFAQWQKESQETQLFIDQLAYWKRKLADASYTKLPYDFAPESGATHHGATIVSRICDAEWLAFKDCCKSHTATPFMGLSACLQLLLSRLTGQSDITIGSPIAGRLRQELEPLIGCFLNTLCLRTDVREDETFAELLSQVRHSLIDAYKNQDVPFERVLSEIQIDRDINHSPLFNVMLNLLSYQSSELKLQGLQIERFDINEPLAKFDVTIYAEPIGEELELRLVYNSGLFSKQRMEFVLDQFVHLINSVTVNPNTKLSDLSLVTERCRRIIADPTQSINFPVYPTIAEKFHDVSAKYTDATAIESQDERVSYAELQQRATKLCQRILQLTTDATPVVAVRFEKSIDLIVSMLAVQLAKRVLVCIDPAFPIDRQQQLLELSYTNILIDSSGLQSIDAQTNLPEHFRDLKPAYIFFTSGTTGTPKAVIGSRQGLAHFVAWQREQFELGPGDRFAQLTATSFDVVLREVFTPLTSGATICIPPTSEMAVSTEVLRWANKSSITVLHSVPSLLQHWLNSDSQTRIPSLRYLFSAGEPLTDRLCNRLQSRLDTATIVNLYGPTETTLAKFYKLIEKPRSGTQFVGGALPQTQALILCNDRQAAVGEIGEIAIRTPYRSHGYLDTQATEKSFISNRWTDCLDDLIYKTGDRGRITPDGELEILGRRDDQVKIRGVRVEPNEVASVIRQHQVVKDCAVIAMSTGDGEKQLVAYVVPTIISTSDGVVPQLATYLSQKLPPAMSPSRYVLLETLPLLNNGKVDRRSLPLPTIDDAVTSQNVEPLRTKTETALAAIWQEVLGKTSIGRRDSFFAIGGHSLLAAQVISRIEQRFKLSVPLRSVFENPALDQFASYVDQAKQNSSGLALPSIQRRVSSDETPLSLAQEALWFLDRMSPNSGAYTTYPMLRVHGYFDLETLQRALDVVVQRHEVLRTTFPEVSGAPVQQIAPHPSSNIEYISFEDLPVQRRDHKLAEWMDSQLHNGIDLQHGPIVRLNIARLAADHHVVVVAWHHIVHDGWSLGVLAREILTAYDDLANARPISLPALQVQYVDWAIWQRQLLSGQNLERLAAYWKQKLAGLEPLDLLTDSPRPSVRTTTGDWVACDFKSGLSHQIDDFARARGVTPFMVFLTAFYVTLARYSGQSDFAIGSPVANRRKQETEGLIGYFINMLVLRPELEAAVTFSDALEIVKSTVLDAFEHQDMTLDQVVHTVNPVRDTSRHPLFQAMFVLHNNAPLPNVASGLRFEPMPNPPVHSSYFELNLVLQQTEEQYRGRLVFNSDLFGNSTMQRLVSSMQLLLASGIQQPDQAWRSISILDQLQSSQLERFAMPENPIQARDCNSTIHREFDRRAECTPSAIALIDGQREFTYAELKSLADGFAIQLKAMSVKPGDYVALLLPRSADALVAMLGILKAGAAYVPLDEKSPVSRNQAILEDCGASLLVADIGNTNIPDNGIKRLQGIGISELAFNSAEVFDDDDSSTQPAYVIYTSGSTGNPKGVLVSHSAVLAYTQAAARDYEIVPSDRVLQFSSLSFDAHVEEVFVTLLSGATLVLRSDSMLDSVERFLAECEAKQITVLSMSTGFWHEIALETAESNITLPPSLRSFVIGGEAASSERVRSWFATHGNQVRLVNSYGPTETTVVATTTELTKQHGDSGGIPIGRPLPNTLACVLDANLAPVPIGVRGELYLGGLSVADGYLRNDVLTAQKFIDDPFENGVFGTRANARLYRTGDVVAWRQDGQLAFFGRTDHQLKVRGFRVELGEIENAIRLHPLVRDVVVTDGGSQSAPVLTAYIVTDGPDVLNTLTLRQFLGPKVPEYMLPVHMIILDQIPTTISGKVDRKALPRPDTSAQPVGEFVAPTGRYETELVTIVADVLQRERVGVTDNFFEIGGNSLLALRLTSRVRKTFNVDLPLVQLFTSPTVAALAAILERAQSSEQDISDDPLANLAAYQFTSEIARAIRGDKPSNIVELRESKVGHPIFCIHGLGGHVVNFIPLSRELATERPIIGLQGQGVGGRDDPHESIPEMAECYAAQILTLQPSGPIQLIGWSMGGLIALELTRKLQAAGRDVNDLILIDTHLTLKDRSLEEITEESVMKQIAPRVGLSVKALRRMTIEQQWEAVLQASEQYTGVVGGDTSAEEIRRLATMCKAHLIALAKYQPKAVNVNIHMLLAARPWRLADPRWVGLCQNFQSKAVAGSHYSMLAVPEVVPLSREIESLLKRTECAIGGSR